ncbi:MAG: hypothetical protein U0527_11500 [Candidatus Eisenbacteria bacterium]
MSKIEGPRVGPTGPDPVLYEDVAQLSGLKAALDPKQTGADTAMEAGASKPLRELLWGRPVDPANLVSSPPLAAGTTSRPTGKELAQTLRGTLERHTSSKSEAEGRLLATLKNMTDAQDGVLMRLAKLTKA